MFLFVKFNFICAIKYGKVIGYTLYEKNTGGIDSNKFSEFYNKFIKTKYKNHLIILDNAGSHNNEYVKQAIINSGNKYLFFVFIITFPNSYFIITFIFN